LPRINTWHYPFGPAQIKPSWEKHPDYVLAWNNLGNALRAAGKYEEAIVRV
jgi:hypothetical protein